MQISHAPGASRQQEKKQRKKHRHTYTYKRRTQHGTQLRLCATRVSRIKPPCNKKPDAPKLRHVSSTHSRLFVAKAFVIQMEPVADHLPGHDTFVQRSHLGLVKKLHQLRPRVETSTPTLASLCFRGSETAVFSFLLFGFTRSGCICVRDIDMPMGRNTEKLLKLHPVVLKRLLPNDGVDGRHVEQLAQLRVCVGRIEDIRRFRTPTVFVVVWRRPQPLIEDVIEEGKEAHLLVTTRNTVEHRFIPRLALLLSLRIQPPVDLDICCSHQRLRLSR